MRIKLKQQVMPGYKIKHDIIDMRTKKVVVKANTHRVIECYRSTSAYIKGPVYEAIIEPIK